MIERLLLAGLVGSTIGASIATAVAPVGYSDPCIQLVRTKAVAILIHDTGLAKETGRRLKVCKESKNADF